MTRAHGPVFGIAVLGILLSAVSVSAQTGFEVGMDGLISYTMTERVERLEAINIQTWAFPAQRIRVGGPGAGGLRPQLTTAFAVADFGEISRVTFSLGLSGLYRLNGSGDRSGVFASAGGGLNVLSDNGTDIQWAGTVGLGAGVPMGSQFAFRPALEVSRSLRSDRRLAGTSVSLILGLSVFTSAGEVR